MPVCKAYCGVMLLESFSLPVEIFLALTLSHFCNWIKLRAQSEVKRELKSMCSDLRDLTKVKVKRKETVQGTFSD